MPRYAVMPLCPSGHTALPAIISFPPDPTTFRWSGPLPFWFGRLPSYPLPAGLLVCLLRLSVGEVPSPSLALSLPSLPRIASRRGRCGSPFLPIFSPLLGASRFPLYDYLEFFGFFRCLLQPVFCFLFFSEASLAYNFHSRLWLDMFDVCSTDSFALLYTSSSPTLSLFPTDHSLPLSLLLPQFLSPSSCIPWLDLIGLRERYTCHITFTHIPRRVTAGIHAGGNIHPPALSVFF